MPWRSRRRNASGRGPARQGTPTGVVRVLAVFPENVHANAGQPACVRVPEGRQSHGAQGSHSVHVLRRGERQAGRSADVYQYRRGASDKGTDRNGKKQL